MYQLHHRSKLLNQWISNPRCTLVCLVACLSCFGCSRGEVLGKVFGKVSFQGKPVTPGIVVFGNKLIGVHMTAKLGEDGTYKIVMAKGEGLPLGDYRVAVAPPMPEDFMGTPAIRDTKASDSFANIPVHYRSVETSPLTLTVHEGENPFDIELTTDSRAGNRTDGKPSGISNP